MNCCTGNCNQGRDCPARCADDEGEELSKMETFLLYLVVFAGMALLVTFAGLLTGYIVGVFA